MAKQLPLPDKHQNFWQLSCIQSAALGLPGMIVGGAIIQTAGLGGAIISVCIGNLILWIIGLSIILMAYGERQNAIENIKNYLGTGSCIFGSIILIIAFLSWYMLQLTSYTSAIIPFFDLTIPSQIKLGAIAGAIIAIISLGGIVAIRHTCVICFPFLLFYAVYLIIDSKVYNSTSWVWTISFQGITSIVATTLPGIMNLPTFFRHARSRADAVLGFSLMTVFVMLFQITCIVREISNPSALFSNALLGIPGMVSYPLCIVFLSLSLLCINLVNIYFASAGLETLVNSLRGLAHKWNLIYRIMINLFTPSTSSGQSTFIRFGYLIIGLLGTTFFFLLRKFPILSFLERIADDILSSLAIVLLLAFFTRIVVRHRPRTGAKIVSKICWFVGSVAVCIVQIFSPTNSNNPFLAGIGMTILFFVCIVFFEEIIWSIDKLIYK